MGRHQMDVNAFYCAWILGISRIRWENLSVSMMWNQSMRFKFSSAMSMRWETKPIGRWCHTNTVVTQQPSQAATSLISMQHSGMLVLVELCQRNRTFDWWQMIHSSSERLRLTSTLRTRKFFFEPTVVHKLIEFHQENSGWSSRIHKSICVKKFNQIQRNKSNYL